MSAPPGPVPPAWTGALLRPVLPCRAMRAAILGDLHEEFARDCAEAGPVRARVRHRERVAGIFLHAVWDTFRLRTWASTPSADAGAGAAEKPAGSAPRAGFARASVTGRTIAHVTLGLSVLIVGIVVNTSAFMRVEHAAAVQESASSIARAGVAPSFAVIAFGILGATSMLICSIAAAHLICWGPRRGGGRATNPPSA